MGPVSTLAKDAIMEEGQQEFHVVRLSSLAGHANHAPGRLWDTCFDNTPLWDLCSSEGRQQSFLHSSCIICGHGVSHILYFYWKVFPLPSTPSPRQTLMII